MIIPGLTDRYNPEDLKAMSLEELLDLQQVAKEKHAEIMMQVESLQQSGGISRAHASGIVELLPPGIVLESYTDYVTQTNYDMTLESLSTAAKVAIGVAIVAGLGALVWYMTKASNAGNSSVNDAAVDKLKKVSGAQGAFSKYVSTAKPSPEALAEMQKAETEHQRKREEKFQRAEEAVARMHAAGVNNFTLFCLTNYKMDGVQVEPVASKIFDRSAMELERDYRTILVPAVDDAVKGSMSPKIRDSEPLKLATAVLRLDKVGMAEDAIVTVTKPIMERARAHMPTTSNPIHYGHHFLDWAEEKAVILPKDAERLRDVILHEDSFKVNKPNYEKMVKDIDDTVRLSKKIKEQEDRLAKATDVPKPIVELLNAYIDISKRKANVLYFVLKLVDLEVQTFNKMVAVVGTELVEDYRRQIKEFEALTLDSTIASETRKEIKALIVHLKKQLTD